MGRPASVQASRAKGHIIARRWSAVVVADKSGPGSSASRNLRTGHCARAARRASRAESPGPVRESPSTGDRSRNSSDMLHGRFERGGHCTPAHGPRHAAESTADMRRSVVHRQDRFTLYGGRGGVPGTLSSRPPRGAELKDSPGRAITRNAVSREVRSIGRRAQATEPEIQDRLRGSFRQPDVHAFAASSHATRTATRCIVLLRYPFGFQSMACGCITPSLSVARAHIS